MRKSYRGRDIEVTFDLDLCTHVAECLRGDPNVFRLRRRPWVQPDAGNADEIAEVIERCPSGALQYQRLDGKPPEQARTPVTVTPIRDGPLLIRGRIEVARDDGTVETLPRASLCRCGQSEHKPFCDNRHLSTGFRAPGTKFKIHLSPVRPAVNKPISKSADPRGAD